MHPVEVRLNGLPRIEGWFDGDQGVAISKKFSQDVQSRYAKFYNHTSCTPPSVFPTVDGKISFEWSNNSCEITLEITVDLLGLFHLYDVETKFETTRTLNLMDEEDWISLNNLIQKYINV